MPPRDLTSRPAKADVYSVLLVVSAVFLLVAVAVTVGELRSDYDFMGTAETMSNTDTGDVLE